MIIFFIGFILVMALTIFWRKCVEPRLSRFVCLIFTILGFIPIANLVTFIIGIVILAMLISNDDISLKENKFTKFWFDND